MFFKKVDTLEQVTRYAGDFVAYQARGSCEDKGYAIDPGCVRYGYVAPMHQSFESGEWGYRVFRVLQTGKTHEVKGLAPQVLKEQRLFMREATREEVREIRQMVMIGKAEIEGMEKLSKEVIQIFCNSGLPQAKL